MINRRHALALASAFWIAPACAQQPWTARLIAGGFDGSTYHGGLHVALQPGWKTYWRVPGAGGVPPELRASGDNLSAFAFACPVPSRFKGEDGESIGYKHEVVFPFTAAPRDLSKPLAINLSVFIGVCEVVCIPVMFEQQMVFAPTSQSTPDSRLLQLWQNKLPLPSASGPVQSAQVEAGPEPLVLSLSQPVADLFIEGNALHYFHAPRFEYGRAVFKVSGIRDVEELRGQKLRITVAMDAPVEQVMTVV